LPEAQLDRFTVELSLGYPPEDQEVAILAALQHPDPLAALEPAASLTDVIALVDQVRRLHVDGSLHRYVVKLLQATREEPRIQLGASPRGGIALTRMAQGHAAVAGRDHVLPDDIQAVAGDVLAHRLVLETKARYAGVVRRQLISELVARIPVPV
jgi:MoxR-like ATPase